MLRLGWQRGAVAVAVLAGLAGGCYDWIPVRPTELPKLSAGAPEVEQTNGNRIEVKQPAVVRIETPWGAKKYHQPVARIDEGLLTIGGDNASATQIPLDQIRSVRVGKLNTIDTAASALVLGAVVVGTVLFFAWLKPVMSHGVE